jgi:hypothetical protein
MRPRICYPFIARAELDATWEFPYGAEMDETKVAITLTRAEAVVLIEFLMRFRDKERLAIEHESEQQLLWDLCCVVESQLPELFDPQWKAIVEQSQTAVLAAPSE